MSSREVYVSVSVVGLLAGPMLLVMALVGCGPSSAWMGSRGQTVRTQSQRIESQDNPFRVTLAPSKPLVARTIGSRAVQFEVLQVQAPVGEFSGSEKIWNHLDEQAIGIEAQIALRRNGFRVGLGRPESWPPVRAILQTVPKRIVRHLPPSLPNSLSVSLQLSGQPADRDVFYYRRDGTLVGNFYPAASNVLRLTWEFNSDNVDEVVVYITPEIRQQQKGLAYKPTPAGVAQVPIYEGQKFGELACRVVIPKDGYVVLGPSPVVNRTGLVGKEFLIGEIDGEAYETMLVIVPRVLDLSGESPNEGRDHGVSVR